MTHPGLADLFGYSVAACLQDRRTRRLAQGASIVGYDSANGPELYTRHVIEGYAHLDLWLGRDAERDVFPIALAELERHA